MNVLLRTTALTAATLAMSTQLCAAQGTRTIGPAPMSRLHYEQLLKTNPALLRVLTHPRTMALAPAAKQPAGSPWQPLTNQPNFSASSPLLLTDGTIIVQDADGSLDGNLGSAWFRLTPDINGSYVNGTWSQLASMQKGYVPLYTASAILPDGRLLIEGGEYNDGNSVWSGQGAIYDPVANRWTKVSPPAGMGDTSAIGDASSVVLPNGTFLLTPVYDTPAAPEDLFDAKTLTWTATGIGDKISADEASQALLPTGEVLTGAQQGDEPGSETYNAKSGKWKLAGEPGVKLWDEHGEVGPMVTLLNGTVLAIGSTLGHTAIYAGPNKWTVGPDLPVIDKGQYGLADAPAAVLPSGKVLLMGSPGYAVSPAHFFLYDGKTITQTVDTPNAPNISNFQGNMLVLPTGQIMLTTQGGDVEIYTDPATPATGAAPTLVNWCRLRSRAARPTAFRAAS